MRDFKLWRLPLPSGSLFALAVVVMSGLLAGCGSSEDGNVLGIEATIAGQSAADSSGSNPVEIDDAEVTVLAMQITNPGADPVTVEHVRLEGRLLNFIFLTYNTGVNQIIEPGETREVAFPIDFFDLDGQANGLLRSKIRLLGAEDNVLASEDFTLKANGGLFSNMSMLTLGLALAALLTFVWNMLKIARRALPSNRFLRGLRFLYTGVAGGLAISAASSTLGIWPLAAGVWIPLTVGAALVTFAIGYLAPGRLIDYIDEENVMIDLRRPKVPDQLSASKLQPVSPAGQPLAPAGDFPSVPAVPAAPAMPPPPDLPGIPPLNKPVDPVAEPVAPIAPLPEPVAASVDDSTISMMDSSAETIDESSALLEDESLFPMVDTATPTIDLPAAPQEEDPFFPEENPPAPPTQPE